MRGSVLLVVATCCCALAGCYEYTEDAQGNTHVGLPGTTDSTSKTPPATLSPADMGMPPEEAAKLSGPVLVLSPDQSNKRTHYHYYETGANNCQRDLAKLVTERAASNATGAAPYCAPFSAAPPSS